MLMKRQARKLMDFNKTSLNYFYMEKSSKEILRIDNLKKAWCHSGMFQKTCLLTSLVKEEMGQDAKNFTKNVSWWDHWIFLFKTNVLYFIFNNIFSSLCRLQFVRNTGGYWSILKKKCEMLLLYQKFEHDFAIL